jgi:hypothetical protein
VICDCCRRTASASDVDARFTVDARVAHDDFRALPAREPTRENDAVACAVIARLMLTRNPSVSD